MTEFYFNFSRIVVEVFDSYDFSKIGETDLLIKENNIKTCKQA